MVSKSSCVRPTTHELTTQVNEANEVLSDAARRAVYDAEQARCGDDVSGTGWTSCHARPHLCICKLLRAGVAQKNGWTHCGAPYHCRG